MWALLLKKFKQPSITIPPQRSVLNVNPVGQIKYPDWNINDAASRYCTIDDIYSIIGRLARTCASVPIYPYFEKNEQAAKKLKRLPFTTKSYERRAIELKALEDLPENDPVYKLLQQPSLTLGRFEFYMGCFVFLLGGGELILLKEKGKITGKVKQLHYLYPQHTQLIVSNTYPQKIEGYRYSVDGQVVMDFIPPEDVIHVRFFNPNFNATGDELRGLSPIRVLTSRLGRIASNMNVSTAQLRNGGVPGILYDKVPDDGGVVADKMKEEFYKYLNKPENKGAPFISGHADFGYIQLGLPLADMEVAALEKIDFKKLCNAYSVSDTLFNNDTAATESNVKEMRKALYTDGCLPHVRMLAEALELSLRDDFTDKKRVIYTDTSEIPELQDDYQEMVTWLKDAWWITPDEKRAVMKWDESTEPLFKQYFIPSGMQLLSDMIIPDPIEPPDDNEKIP